MSISDRTANVLRRLHSLTGVLPVGVFLLFHLFTNSKAVHGPEHFNASAVEISRLPYVVLIELFGIALPILFHLVLGLIIATSGQLNVGAYRFGRNWGYVLQRATGVFLAVFIIFHVWTTRFAPGAEADLFGHMTKVLRDPGTFVFYVLGVTAAAYHLGNGLFGFAIHWGIATGRTAQRRAALLGTLVFLVLTLVGVNSLFAFLDPQGERVPPVRLFERAPEAAAPVVAHDGEARP
jgi:succinate dehydrogenase / fumarate reductase cytochrome b subunit